MYKFDSNSNVGLVYYWPIFDNVKDLIGGAHMVLGTSASLAMDRYGNERSAISLNNGFYTVPDNIYFNSDFTITVWVKTRSINNYCSVLDFSNGVSKDNVILGLSHLTTGRPYFSIENIELSQLISDKMLKLNQWEHIAAVLHGTIGTIYINGALAGTSTMQRPGNLIRTKSFIGRNSWSSLGYPDANADIDELKIFSRALDPEEIKKDMNMTYVTKIFE